MAGRATSRSDLDRLVVPQTGLDVQNFLSGLPARHRQLADHVLTIGTTDMSPLRLSSARILIHLEGEQRRAKQPLIAPSRT